MQQLASKPAIKLLVACTSLDFAKYIFIDYPGYMIEPNSYGSLSLPILTQSYRSILYLTCDVDR
jgi:hypothetical protein